MDNSAFTQFDSTSCWVSDGAIFASLAAKFRIIFAQCSSVTNGSTVCGDESLWTGSSPVRPKFIRRRCFVSWSHQLKRFLSLPPDFKRSVCLQFWRCLFRSFCKARNSSEASGAIGRSEIPREASVDLSQWKHMREARKQLSHAMKHPLFSWILDLPLGLCESRHTRTSRQYAERNKTHPLLSYMSSRCWMGFVFAACFNNRIILLSSWNPFWPKFQRYALSIFNLNTQTRLLSSEIVLFCFFIFSSSRGLVSLWRKACFHLLISALRSDEGCVARTCLRWNGSGQDVRYHIYYY